MTIELARSPTTLADLCTGIVKLACSLEAERGADAELLAAKFHQAFVDFEDKAQRAGCDAEGVQLAKYALCAWIDERILASTLPARARWSSEPLQLRYFDDFSAGEEFYARLESVRAARGRQEVLEVYGLCIALASRANSQTSAASSGAASCSSRSQARSSAAAEPSRSRGPGPTRPSSPQRWLRGP